MKNTLNEFKIKVIYNNELLLVAHWFQDAHF